MQEFVPLDKSGKHIPLLACGDGLSTDGMRRAKKALANCAEMNRLNGLVEAPEEFHKQGILLQV